MAALAGAVVAAPSAQAAAAQVGHGLSVWAPTSPIACALRAGTESALWVRTLSPPPLPAWEGIRDRLASASSHPIGPPTWLVDVEIDPRIERPWPADHAVEHPIVSGGVVHGWLLGGATSTFPAADLHLLLRQAALWLGPVIAGLDRLYVEARWDSVTDLYNRRFLDENLAREQALALRHRLPVSLAVADVDRFKQVNDRFGHPAGDRALREIGLALKGAVRSTDLVCRYGGDEFAVLLPHTGAAGARESALRFQAAVQARPFYVEDQPLRLGLSVGAATFDPLVDDPASPLLLDRADADLYRSKTARRAEDHAEGAASRKG